MGWCIMSKEFVFICLHHGLSCAVGMGLRYPTGGRRLVAVAYVALPEITELLEVKPVAKVWGRSGNLVCVCVCRFYISALSPRKQTFGCMA